MVLNESVEKAKKELELQRKKNKELRERRKLQESTNTPKYPYNNDYKEFRDIVDIKNLHLNLKDGKVERSKMYCQDHIWPLSKGGVNHPINMQLLTNRENTAKRDKHNGEDGVSYEDFMLAVTAFA